MTSIYSFSATSIDGKEISFQQYQGKVLLIVNTASKCGFTSQYQGLETLHQKYQAQGLEILGFPCNQFGKQEPGNEQEIKEFCQLNYDVSFSLFKKIDVNGDNTHPLYQFLKSQAKGIMGSETIKWNFTKFLVDQSGKVLKRYGSMSTPESIENDIAALLQSAQNA